MKVTFPWLNSIRHTTQNSETKQKTRFQKGSVENADFYKPVYDKIMTIYE